MSARSSARHWHEREDECLFVVAGRVTVVEDDGEHEPAPCCARAAWNPSGDGAMALTGTLRTWNADRGFGFIAPTHGGPELFVHISAFPRDGTRPVEGETLVYELGRGPDGRPRATKVVRTAIGTPPPRARAAPASPARPRPTRHWMGTLLALALVAAVGAYGYDRYRRHMNRLALEQSPATPTDLAPATTPATSSFRCDGRIHCSQMTSCAEATWFINHCPGTRMDGNHDGVPCEQQWCTGPFAR